MYKKNYDKVKNLVDISALVTHSVDFFSIKDRVIEKMLDVVHPTKACINLFYDNNYEYAYLVCSETLEVIPKIYPPNSKIGRKIKFSEYPSYIHESVYKKKIIRVYNIDTDESNNDEKNIAKEEGYCGRIVFPLIVSDKVVGFMTCFLDKNDFLEEEDIDFISSVASLISLSIHITNRNKDTDILIKKLRNSITAINEATKKLYYNKNINIFLDDLSKKACHITKSMESAIVIKNSSNNKKILSFYNKNTINQSHIYPIMSFIENNEEIGKFFNERYISKNIDTLIYYKLEDNEQTVGYIICANSKNYTDDDLNILSIFAKQLNVAMKLFEYNLKEINHKVLTSELEILNRQQKFLMDKKTINKYKKGKIDFYHKSAKVVGGDFYYCVEFDEKLICIVADVMGHGMVSNYVVAIIKGAFKVLSKTCKTPSEMMNNLNSMLFDEFDKMGVFTTCVICMIDSNNDIFISNAGHYNPIIVDKDKNILKNLDFKKGIPLGIINESIYEDTKFSLDNINSFWMYTDGVIEVRNKLKEEFGIERFEEFITESTNYSDKDTFNKFTKKLLLFSNKESYEDDILIVRYKSRS